MMSRYKALDEELYGPDGDELEVPSRAISPMTEEAHPEPMPDTAAAPEESTASPVSPTRYRFESAKPAPQPAEKKSWSPDFLAAIAAFTRNPALMQQLQARESNKHRSEEMTIRAAQQEKADAANAEHLGIARNREARDQTKFEAERPYFGSGAKSKDAYAAATNQRMQSEAMDNDRNSDRSKAVSAAAASALQAQVAMMQGKADPKIVDMMKRTADSMAGMSVSEIKSIFKSSPLARVVPQALGEAQHAFSNAMSKDASARGWYSAKEGVRQGDERIEISGRAEDRAEAKDEELTIKKPQEKLNADIGKLEVAAQQMGEALRIKGNVNTGPIIQGLRDLVSADKFDALTSDDRAQLRALGAQIFNEKVHEISGAAVTPSEWARIGPQIPGPDDDDRVYVQKLQRALAVTEQVLAERRKEYQQKGGMPADRSVTAREQRQKLRPTAVTPKPVADPQAEAKQWLAEHPNDPDAPAVRKKLGL